MALVISLTSLLTRAAYAGALDAPAQRCRIENTAERCLAAANFYHARDEHAAKTGDYSGFDSIDDVCQSAMLEAYTWYKAGQLTMEKQTDPKNATTYYLTAMAFLKDVRDNKDCSAPYGSKAGLLLQSIAKEFKTGVQQIKNR
jgi:hypothetical protein